MHDQSTADLNWNNDSALPYGTASVVDRYSAFDGAFRSQRDLKIEGELKGTLSCDGTLFVAEGASVAASVDAENITVAGDLSGDIHCRGRLQILPSGRVRAVVSTGSLIIQEGAVYEGQLDMAGIELSAPRPLRSGPSANPVSVEAGAAERQPGNGTTFIRRLGSPEAPWESPSTDQDGNGADAKPIPDGSAT